MENRQEATKGNGQGDDHLRAGRDRSGRRIVVPSRPQNGRYAGVLAAVILPSLILAQAGFSFRDSSGDLTGKARNGGFAPAGSGYEVRFDGQVALSSKSRGFSLASDKVTTRLAKAKGSDTATTLEWAKATGKVRITQTSGSKKSNLASSSATYTVRGKGGEVSASGSVRIENIDGSKRQTVVATGSSCTATLAPDSKRGIDKATLNGPVRIEIVQAGTGGSKVVLTGNKLVMNGNTLTLSGKVSATGTGASQFGNVSGVDTLVAQLNDNGEMKSANFRSGGR